MDVERQSAEVSLTNEESLVGSDHLGYLHSCSDAVRMRFFWR